MTDSAATLGASEPPARMATSGPSRLGCHWVQLDTLAAMMLRMKHLFRLSRDVGRFALINRVWWFIPMMALLALIMVAVTSTQAVVPVAVYTLF